MVKFKQNILLISTITLIALIIGCAVLGIVNLMTTRVANAQSDTFEVIFPKTSYIQSTSPTLIGANDNYLIVYDSKSKVIYSRSNMSSQTTLYPLSQNEVKNVFVVGSKAFIIADDKYFTIDLSQKDATPIEITITSPQDVSYLTTDGTYLYAHSSSGYISLYDENLQITLGVDNQKNSILTGKNVIAASGSTAYVFEYYWGESIIREYDLIQGKQTNSTIISQFIQEAYVGDVIYAIEANPNNIDAIGKNIICIDKVSGRTLFTSDVCPDSFFAYGSNVFAIEGKNINIYTLNSENTTLTLNSTISMTGNDLRHFNTPCDVDMQGDEIIVADTNNNRISFLSGGNMSVIALEFSPKRVCTSDTMTFVSNESQVTCISDGVVTSVCNLSNIKDILYLDMLYILNDDGVYALVGGAPVKLMSVENARRIACAKDGNIIYILKDDCVMRITRHGKPLPNAIDDDLSNASDIAIDYLGQIFVTYENSISKYYHGEKKSEYPLIANGLSVDINSACMYKNNMYFVTSESFLGATNINAQDKETFISFTPTLDRNVTFSFIKANDENALFYDVDGRDESITFASDDVIISIDNMSVGANSNLVYALKGDEIITVDKSQFDVINLQSQSGEYVINEDTLLYSLPYCENDTVAVSVDTRVRAMFGCDQYEDGAWLIVEYNGDAYFAQMSTLSKVEPLPMPNPDDNPSNDENEKVVGKAKADRVGGLVKVYGSQYASGSVLMEIVDGTEIEILGEAGEFYKVLIGEKVGYMYKSEVVIGGLTTVQIIAIVLCIIVLIAGSAIFVAIHITRKNEEEKKKQNVAKVE